MVSAVEATNFVPVAKAADFASGVMKNFTVNGREILLAKVNGRYYAADNICPHMGGKLAMGKLEGTIVTCPRHASKFDLTDGRVLRWTDWTGIKASVSKLFRQPRPLTIYPVKVDGDTIQVGVP